MNKFVNRGSFVKILKILLFVFLSVLFVSCAGVRNPAVMGYVNIILTQYGAGSAVEDAEVRVLNAENLELIGRSTTDGCGETRIGLSELPEFVNIVFSKYEYALSVIEGLKTTEALDKVIESVIRKADLNLDPNTQNIFPEYEFKFYYPPEFWGDDPVPIDPEKPVNSSFNMEITVNKSKNHIYAILPPLLGRVPGDSTISKDFGYQVENKNHAEFEIPVAGYFGITDLNVIMYDYNGNRLHRVVYLDIQPENPAEMPEKTYTPIPASSLGFTNIIAYTRSYGKDFLASARTAPENSNLFTGVFCVDHQTAISKGLIDGDTAKPDGYSIYRSFDGSVWEKVGFISSSKADQRLSWSDNKILSERPGLFFSSSAFFVDTSARLEVGKEVFYAVSSVYGRSETDKTFLGSVTPLEPYKVDLINPSCKQVRTWRRPEFKFGPDRVIDSPMGEVNYFYRLFVYDIVQDMNRWIIPVKSGEISVPNYGALFETGNPGGISVMFTGNLLYDDVIWYSYFDGQSETLWQPYSWQQLEAQKTYSWGVNLAFAAVKSEDNSAMAFSVAADFHPYFGSFGVDPVTSGMPPDWMYEFTTGTN